MGQPHVVIFPYDEEGHVNPAFALGRALAGRGMRITVLLSANRYAKSSHSIRDTSESSLFRVEAIPNGGEVEGKHDDDVTAGFKQYTLQMLEPGVEELMQRLQPRPSCLISDILLPWSLDLADRLHLPCFQLCVYPAISYLLALHIPTLIAKGLLPFQAGMEDEVIDFIPGLGKGFRLSDVPVDFLCRDNKQLDILLRLQRSMRRGAGVVINTIHELEPDALDELFANGLSVYAVGPLSSMASKDKYQPNVSLFVEDEGCLRWLDLQHPGTVVYVAFGSIISLSKQEIQELALGLEACGQPFLWVLRGPSALGCSDGIDDPMSTLPAGFLERTKERGCVVAWAPQMAVLSHPSIGCFISHCGMGSMLEALWAGVPMIGGFYKVSDQNTICRLLTKDWGVAMALTDQGEAAGCAPLPPLRCAIETRVKEMIHGERGLALSQKTLQLKAILRSAVEPDGSSYSSLTKFANALTS